MNKPAPLARLIELAAGKNLDLFFRVGRGYLTRAMRGGAQHQQGSGASPLGVQARAEARIVCTLAPPLPEARLHAWPDGSRRARPLPVMR